MLKTDWMNFLLRSKQTKVQRFVLFVFFPSAKACSNSMRIPIGQKDNKGHAVLSFEHYIAIHFQ